MSYVLWIGLFHEKKQTYTYLPERHADPPISKARVKGGDAKLRFVSVYHEKMLGGKWHVFEFYQV